MVECCSSQRLRGLSLRGWRIKDHRMTKNHEKGSQIPHDQLTIFSKILALNFCILRSPPFKGVMKLKIKKNNLLCWGVPWNYLGLGTNHGACVFLLGSMVFFWFLCFLGFWWWQSVPSFRWAGTVAAEALAWSAKRQLSRPKPSNTRRRPITSRFSVKLHEFEKHRILVLSMLWMQEEDGRTCRSSQLRWRVVLQVCALLFLCREISFRHCFQKGGFSQKQKNVVWTPSGDAGSAGPSKFGGGGQKCTVCDKTVYAAETVSYEKKPYHAECFKCSNCVKKISPSGAAMFEEKLFCSKCFADGGYRQKQVATASKTPAQPGSSAAPSKFGGGGNKCVKCDKTVYAAETVSFEKAAYHAECFKCDSCTKIIQSASGAAVFENLLLCVKCFKDGGYKQKQTNTVKEYKPSTTNAAPSKFGGGGQKCYTCQTTVYAAEAISYEKKLFHSDCLKCRHW